MSVRACAHGRQQRAHEEKGGHEVDLHRGRELFGRQLVRGRHVEKTGVADDDVDHATVMGLERRGELGHLGRYAQVGLEGGGVVADGTGRVSERPGAACDEGHAGPRTGETRGDRPPDAARRPGDEGHAARERAVHAHRPPFADQARRRNSSRVLASSRKVPRSADVIVFEFCFSTPRIIMQR